MYRRRLSRAKAQDWRGGDEGRGYSEFYIVIDTNYLRFMLDCYLNETEDNNSASISVFINGRYHIIAETPLEMSDNINTKLNQAYSWGKSKIKEIGKEIIKGSSSL
jgi:hypothetical protein